MHPATTAMLRNFRYTHLPEPLQEVSAPICDLAHHCANTLEGPELTAGLRKLLEAKDCLVRAKLQKLESEKEQERPCRGCSAAPADHPDPSGCSEWH